MATIFRGRVSGCQIVLWVEEVLVVRVHDRRVLAIDFDVELGLITCERSGVGQAARLAPCSVACAGCSVPINSGAVCVHGDWREKQDVGKSRMFSDDMVKKKTF